MTMTIKNIWASRTPSNVNYEQGSELQKHVILGGNRLLFYTGITEKCACTSGVYDLTSTGTKIYLNSVAWMLSAPGTKIAFISNSTFVSPSYSEYTSVLENKGYTIDRFNPKKNLPDADTLNTYNIVIISRVNNSSDFGGSKASFWNTDVTVPLINLNGSTVIHNVLGFVDTSRIIDTISDIKYKVPNTSNPVFDGVAFNVNNITENVISTLLNCNQDFTAHGECVG